MKTVLSNPSQKPAHSPSFLSTYGPCAVVTGASSGLGRELAKHLAAIGFDLILVARNGIALSDLAAELATIHGTERSFIVHPADLGNADEIEELLNATATIDVGLVVTAAGFGTSGEFITAEVKDELAMLEVNCRSPLLLAHHFGVRLASRGRGGIIFFGSLVGYQGAPRAAHYAATKAYIQTLAEGLHHELLPRGVAVLACAPGPVHTGFAARAQMIMNGADDPGTVARETLAALGRRMTVTPGPHSKFLTWSLMTAPRFLRVRIMGKIMAGMTRRSS
jgi:short-subunit dehydrogenase